MDDLRAFFRGFREFKNLRDEGLSLLVSSALIEDFAAGRVIVPQGTKGDSIWFIISGKTEVLQDREKAGRVSLAVLGPNSYFGEISVMTGSPTTAEVVAKERCKTVRIPGRILTEILDTQFSTMAEFTKTIVRRLSDNLRKK